MDSFSNKKQNVLIIGAGSAGRLLIKDIIKNDTTKNIVGIIDDDNNKLNTKILNVTVIGNRDSIENFVKVYRVNSIYIALPSIDVGEKNKIISICKKTNCVIKDMPSLYQFFDNDVSSKSMSDINYDILLGRKPVVVNNEEIFNSIKNKTVLVSGGGGSIGSELCRQIAKHEPKCLIIFDIYENNAYEIQQELLTFYPKLNLGTLIGSIRDFKRLDEVFNKYKPDIVYHAAAHKHVPLMEDSPKEAIKNNVFGTYYLSYMSLKYNVEKFVMISTDKAVNPTSIMGASKRICELIIQIFDRIIESKQIKKLPLFSMKDYISNDICVNNKTCFVAVRFGNVLGSNGSVIPKFRWQIENGGPVTVTHPDIIRYFMTIKEAVSLVLQAGANAKSGEIYVLDMGDPIKIVDLARNLIELSGYEPDKDIKIVYTGLRPGEKLYEEKLMAEEGLEKTHNELIHVAKPISVDIDSFFSNLESLYLSIDSSKEEIIRNIKLIINNYKSGK